MILEVRRLWFKKVTIFLEDNLPSQFELEKKYDSVTIISHKKLDLRGWKVREKDTSLVDLTVPNEEIFKKFSDTTRNEINKTLRDDLYTVYFGKNSDELYSIYCNFEKAQSRVPVVKKEMDVFTSPHIAYKGDILYGLYVIESFPYMRVRSIFSKRLMENDTEMVKRISNAGRRLFWEVFQNAKKRGFLSVDLASVNMDNPGTRSIAKFKLSFGGNICKEYTYMYTSRIFSMFEKLGGLTSFIRYYIDK